MFDKIKAFNPDIVLVTVEYDGAGDEGSIQDVTAYLADNVPVDLSSDLWREIERHAYKLLESEHGGWEINGGAFGTFTFDVTNSKISLEHNDRIESYDTTTTEF